MRIFEIYIYLVGIASVMELYDSFREAPRPLYVAELLMMPVLSRLGFNITSAFGRFLGPNHVDQDTTRKVVVETILLCLTYVEGYKPFLVAERSDTDTLMQIEKFIMTASATWNNYRFQRNVLEREAILNIIEYYQTRRRTDERVKDEFELILDKIYTFAFGYRVVFEKGIISFQEIKPAAIREVA